MPNSLQQILAYSLQGILLANKKGKIVYANPAFLRTHGCKRLKDLAVDAQDYYASYVLSPPDEQPLPSSDYPLPRLMKNGAFDDLTVEVTARKSGNDTFCIVSIRGVVLDSSDDNDKNVQYALILKDITDYVDANERFEKTFAANPAPALIYHLEKQRFVKVNQGFVDMSAMPEQDILGLRLHQLDVLGHAEHREAAIKALENHQTIAQQEAQLQLPDGGKHVVVAGQPIYMQDEACMLFTFVDDARRKQAQSELRHSHAQFSRIFDTAPLPMLVCLQDGWVITQVNEAFTASFGFEHDEVQNTALHSLAEPTQHQLAFKNLQMLLIDKPVHHGKVIEIMTASGDICECKLDSQIMHFDEQAHVLCILRDVTSQQRSDRELMAAIETVMQDASWFSTHIMEQLAAVRHKRAPASGLEVLTRREHQVLECICHGMSDAEMAKQLKLSRNTIRNYVASLYQKIGVKRRSAAVIWGRDRGIAS